MKKILNVCVLLGLAMVLGGCEKFVLFNSAGQLGQEQGDMILFVIAVMLIVVIPVLFMSFYFPFKYRENNKKARYEPNWDHSSIIEVVVWGIPVAIILVLATIVYKTSYSMDPRVSLMGKYDNMEKREITIKVLATDWKWVFFYPEENIATVNEIAIPVNTSIKFILTSDTGMASFSIPEIGSQLYAMPGMENRLHLVAEKKKELRGISGNYTGFGHSGMKFKVISTDNAGYDAWVAKVKGSEMAFDDATYKRLQEKTRNHKVEYFSQIVDPQIFENIIRKFAAHN